MQIPRFYLEKKNIVRDRFYINDTAICKHLRQVLRFEKGSKIMLFDGEGREYEVEIRFLTKEQVSGVVLSTTELKEEWPYLVLGQAFPKAGKADEIIRMNTEIGVSEFVFFESDYSIPKLEHYLKDKVERMKRVILEASRQSERAFVPIINNPLSFDDMLDFEADVKILLHSRMVGVSENLLEIKKTYIKENDKILILVGPEGGFSPAEVEKAKEKKFKIAYINSPILRTETAGIVASGILIAN